MRSIHSLVLVSGTLFAVGCTETPPATSTTTQGETANNKLASNKLASNKLASNKLASNKLASNKLASNKLAVNKIAAGDLLETADGREVLSYMTSCAIASGTSLVAATDVACTTDTDCQSDPQLPFTGTCGGGKCTFDFPGELGLAPQWLNHELDDEGQGWVSACLFARVNAHDTSEEISLRGPNNALAVGADEAALYDVEEGAFYGNLFTPGNDPPNWIACEGEGQASGEFGGLVDRDCTEPDPANPGFTQCGFIYAGFCGDYTPAVPNPQACDEFSSNGYYEDCHATASLLTHHGHDHEHGRDGDYGDDHGHDGDYGDDHGHDDDDHGHDGDDHGHNGCHQHGDITYQQVITTFVTD